MNSSSRRGWSGRARCFATVTSGWLAFATQGNAQVVAFPGALGFGAKATGAVSLDANGKHTGGNVYHVTNLNDSGTGSFRDAVSSSGRVVVFDVGGYINLASAVSVQKNITIAGQTAPGGGIGFTGAEISFANRSNIICRFIRIYPGGASSSSDDCLSFYRANNLIVDHTSLDFAKWNNIDAVGDSKGAATNITVQNSIIANPIGQQFGAHTEMVGGFFSWFNNVFANGHNRQPLAKDNTIFINNTLYNYEAGYTTHTSTPFKHDILNNYFICGPASGSGGNTWFQIDTNQSMYYSGNLKDNNKNGALDGVTTAPYPGYQGTGTVLSAPWSSVTTAYLPSVLSPANAVVYDVSNAGCMPRDEIELLVLSQVRTLGSGTAGKGVGTAGPPAGLYTSQTQTGLSNNGFGAIADGTPPIDSDQDGMPDDWENARGLKYKDATDGKLTAASGYTNLEDYLNWLALPHAFVGKNGSLDIDLTQYAGGFPSTAAYALTGITGGTVTQSGQGNSQVHFVPATNSAAAVGGFSFSVSSGGYTMTSAFGVLISANAATHDLVWVGTSATTPPWDTTTTNWTNQSTGGAAAYGPGDRVTFDDTGSRNTVSLTGVLSPSSIEVNTNAQDYTLTGTGLLSGTTALVKDGAGTLTVAPTLISTSGTLSTNSQDVMVGSTANLILGMPVTGAPISGHVSINSGVTLMAINVANSTVTLSKNPAYAGTTTLTFTPYYNYSGPTTFNAGTIRLGDGGSLGTGVLNLYSTLTNSTSSPNNTVGLNNDIIVAAGSTGTLNMGNRFTLGGSVTGGGTLNLNVQTTASRDDLTGSFAAFAGTLNFSGSGGVRLFFNGGSFDGFAAASVNLGSNVSLMPQTYSGGNTVNIGELNGSGTLYGGTTSPVAPTPAVTWSIGGSNTSTTFAGAILDYGVYKSGLTKVGTGTLTLTGTINLSGPMNLNAGTLATLGTFGGPFSINAATLALGTPATPAGTLTANGGLTLVAGTVVYDLSNSPSGTNDKITASGGTLNLTGASTILVNFANGVLGAGTYALIDGTAAKGTTTLPTLVTNPTLPANARQTLTLSCATSSDTTGYLNLTVVNDVAALTWTGGSSNVWSLGASQNWGNAATTQADQFYNFDTVTFNDSVANGAVTLSGTVQPNTLNVTSGNSNFTNYNFGGSGNIGGSTKLIKSGPSTLTLSNTTANTYTGGTVLNGGQITLANATAGLGTGPIYMNGGTTLQLSNAATSLANSLVFTGTNTIFSGNGNSTLVSSLANTLASVGNAFLYLGTSNILSITGDMSGFSGTISLGASSGTLRLNGGNTPSADANVGSADTLFDLGTYTATLSNRNGSPAIYLGGLQGAANTTLIGRQSGSGGYTNTATVTFTATNGGSGAAATATAANGIITGVTLTSGGSGYTAAPTVAFGGGNGSGATATATVSNGVVTALTLTNGGTGTRTASNYIIGSLGTSTTFAGKIVNNPGVTGGGDFLGLNVYKVGLGNWTLSGTSNFVGDVLIQEGTLTVSGSLTNAGDFEVGEGNTLVLSGGTITTPLITVDGSAILTGNGTINGDVVSQGTVTVGSGTLTVNGAIENDGTMRITGDALLMSNGGFVNNGLLDFITGNVLAVPPFVNNGTVIDSTSVKVTQLSKTGTTFNVAVQTYPGHTFTLQRASSLTAPAWQTVQTMAGTGEVLSFSDPNANGTLSFYRFQISP